MVTSAFDQDTVLLMPENMFLSTETELTQYFIKDWSLSFWNKGEWLTQNFSKVISINLQILLMKELRCKLFSRED